jgi:8-oxo-dGTP diphosphatase
MVILIRPKHNVSMRNSGIALAVDVVALKNSGNQKRILLIRRKNEPFKGQWALPGGFIDYNEDPADAAARELREETGLAASGMAQVGAFGKPGRDPRGHVVSIAYKSEFQWNDVAKAGDDAAGARWFDLNDLPALAFDHADIIALAVRT